MAKIDSKTKGAAGGGGGYTTVQDEGTPLTQRTTINFTGAGVTAADSGGITVVTISGGGAGSATVGTSTVNFGTGGNSDTTTVITGQTGISASSVVSAGIRCVASADHSADEHAVEQIQISAGNIVAGTGFTIYARTTNTALRGIWNVQWMWQ